MIFISGVHGVGKSYFCGEVKKVLGIHAYSASTLISNFKKESFTKDKLIADIEGNQPYLLMAVEKLNAKETNYLLDGHFCLLDAKGNVERIKIQTFLDLAPQAIVLLTESPSVIAERRKQRDEIESNIELINKFQQEEISYAKEVSQIINAPLHISKGASDVETALSFIQRIIMR